MKKVILLLSLVLPLVLLFGCESKENNKTIEQPAAAEELKINDYFPIKDNVKYYYKGNGNEYASYTIYNDYTLEDKVQQRIDNGGTEVVKVFQLKEGKLTRIFSKGEVYYRENLLGIKSENEEIILMEPLKQGTTWKLKDSRVRTITNTSADITTPLATYKAIEVTTEGQKDKTIDYYAKNIGLVKSVFISDGNEISSTLSNIEENVPFIQKVNFYYPNMDDGKIYSISKEISFKTNDITKKSLEEAYKKTGSDTKKVFSSNTKINSLYLNKDNMVYIDLNEAFINEMNAGALYEEMILQSIANTFGQYYNAEKVVLTIDGKLYESGHIIFKKGQYLKVKH